MSDLKAQVEATHIIMAFFVYVFIFYFYLPSEAFHVAEEGSIWWKAVSPSGELAAALLQKLSKSASLLIHRLSNSCFCEPTITFALKTTKIIVLQRDSRGLCTF